MCVDHQRTEVTLLLIPLYQFSRWPNHTCLSPPRLIVVSRRAAHRNTSKNKGWYEYYTSRTQPRFPNADDKRKHVHRRGGQPTQWFERRPTCKSLAMAPINSFGGCFSLVESLTRERNCCGTGCFRLALRSRSCLVPRKSLGGCILLLLLLVLHTVVVEYSTRLRLRDCCIVLIVFAWSFAWQVGAARYCERALVADFCSCGGTQ